MPDLPASRTALLRIVPIFAVAGVLGCVNSSRPEASAAEPSLRDIVSPLRSIEFGDTDYADLRPLEKSIGGATIVLLGEQTHGEGSTFKAKTRLVRFLHEKMGFDLMVLESGMYDCVKAWREARAGDSLHRALQGSAFYMYAESREMKPLFDYIDAQRVSGRTLEFTGMDCMNTGKLSQDSLILDLEAFFISGGSKLVPGPGWTWARAMANLVIRGWTFEPKPEQITRFQGFVDSMLAEIPELKPPASAEILGQTGFWQSILRGLRWHIERRADTGGMRRDSLMALNAQGLLENPYRGRKAVFWVHNLHGFRDFQGVREAVLDRDWSSITYPMGRHLSERYGEKLYMLGVTGRDGRYVEFQDRKIMAVDSVGDGRFEYGVDPGLEFGFMDFRNTPASVRWAREEQTLALVDFIAFKTAPAKLMDGLLYIKTSTPTNDTAK
jgi:erythromycin esterase